MSLKSLCLGLAVVAHSQLLQAQPLPSLLEILIRISGNCPGDASVTKANTQKARDDSQPGTGTGTIEQPCKPVVIPSK